jgi:hypothetical protein
MRGKSRFIDMPSSRAERDQLAAMRRDQERLKSLGHKITKAKQRKAFGASMRMQRP